MDALFDTILDKIKMPIFRTGMYLLQISYILALLGIVYFDPTQINKLNILVQLFVAIFLVIRFHPFRSHELHKYDAELIFGSGVFLLANLGITQLVLNYVKSITFNKYSIL